MELIKNVITVKKAYLQIIVDYGRKTLFMPNRTFLVRFCSISGELGGETVRILMGSRAKIPTEIPNAHATEACHKRYY